MKLAEVLKTDVAQSYGKRSLRIPVTIPASVVTQFLELHLVIGGPEVISRSELASKILVHALTAESKTRASKSRTTGGEPTGTTDDHSSLREKL